MYVHIWIITTDFILTSAIRNSTFQHASICDQGPYYYLNIFGAAEPIFPKI